MTRWRWVAAAAFCLMAGAAQAEDVTYGYDSLGRLISVTYTNSGVSKTITYAYDAAGNRTQVTSANGLPNGAPVAVNDSAYAKTLTAVTVSVLANDSDPNSNPLTVVGKSNGTLGTTVINSGTTITYTPSSTTGGPDSFTYTLSDGQGGTAIGTVNVNVNRFPDAVNDSKTTGAGVVANLSPLANDTDPDGNTLKITAKTNPSHGTVIIGGGQVTMHYTPATGYAGPDSFTYTISDNEGGTDTATINITVLAANVAPVAVNDSTTSVVQYFPGGPAKRPSKEVMVLANDSDDNGDTMTVTSVTQGTSGGVVTITGSGSTVTWRTTGTYTADASGSDSFTYTISDPSGLTSTATVYVSWGVVVVQ